MQLSDYITQVQFLLHDQANQDFSQQELVNAINNARLAASIDFQAIRTTYLSPPNNIANSIAYNPVGIIANQEIYFFNNKFSGATGAAVANGGVVVGASVTNGGVNYTSQTTVTFSAGPAGSILATGAAVINAGVAGTPGVIQSINMTQWGQGYLPAVVGTTSYANLPTVTITDPGGGTGATATAVMFNNVYNVLSISNLWGNQRYMLKFRGFTLFQAYMRSQLFFTERPIIWTIQEEQGIVLIQPPPDQGYQTEWDLVSTPQPLTQNADYETEIIGPASDAVQYWAAWYCLNKLQNFNQAEYMLKIYSGRVPKIIIGKQGFRIPNPYHKTFQRRVMR
jgi:hypothetical protein